MAWDDVIVYTVLTHQLTDLMSQPLAHILAQSSERHAQLTSATRPVPVLDIQCPSVSIVTWTEQCLAAFLIRPLTIVFRYAFGLTHGVSASAGWAIFRMTAERIAGLYLRFTLRFNSWNFRYLIISDTRHSDLHRRAVAVAFHYAKPCCMSAFDSQVHSF